LVLVDIRLKKKKRPLVPSRVMLPQVCGSCGLTTSSTKYVGSTAVNVTATSDVSLQCTKRVRVRVWWGVACVVRNTSLRAVDVVLELASVGTLDELGGLLLGGLGFGGG
jgi:hypothetical protein